MTEDPLEFGKELRMKNAKIYHCPHCGAQNTIRHKNRWTCHSCSSVWTPYRLWYAIWLSRQGKLSYVMSILLPVAALLCLVYLAFIAFR